MKTKSYTELCESHPLNKDLDVPFMEAKGAYHIIAEICNLEYIGEGIFKHRDTNTKYVLTKYGFQHAIQYNYHVKYAEAIRELRSLKSDYKVLEENSQRKSKGEISALRQQVESYKKKIKNQADAVNQHREKINLQSEQIKNQANKLKELYAIINEGNNGKA